MIFLRAHHLICLQSFIGKGYSDEFASHLKKISDFLRQKKQIIVITNKSDDICKKCPLKTGKHCSNEEQISHLDEAYLKILKLSTNMMVSFSEVTNIILNSLTKEEFDRNCKTCQWYNICNKYLGKSLKI